MGLKDRGIESLFPVQYSTFRRIYNKDDMIVRDLTGSGKTLGFCLPMVELFRKERLFVARYEILTTQLNSVDGRR